MIFTSRKRRAARSAQLLPHLIDVIQIDVGIPQGVDEFIRLQAGESGNQVEQQCVGGDVQGDT